MHPEDSTASRQHSKQSASRVTSAGKSRVRGMEGEGREREVKEGKGNRRVNCIFKFLV